MNRFLAFLAIALSLTFIPASADAKPLDVVVTFSILGDLTKQVGGDLVDVKTLVGPDRDVHDYKPTPNDSRALAQTDLVIENGLGLEGWLNRLISASGTKAATVIASNDVIPHQRNAEEGGNAAIIDPHAWQDVSNARIYIKNIASALAKARPEDAKAIGARAKALDTELEKLDKWVKAEIGKIQPSQRKIITSHDAFGYFGAAYGVAFTAPQGITTEIEPTATQVAKLIKQMKTEKIQLVFFEKMASPKLISQLAKDARAQVGEPIYSDALSEPDGPAPTYAAMIRYNVEQFTKAMALNGK